MWRNDWQSLTLQARKQAWHCTASTNLWLPAHISLWHFVGYRLERLMQAQGRPALCTGLLPDHVNDIHDTMLWFTDRPWPTQIRVWRANNLFGCWIEDRVCCILQTDSDQRKAPLVQGMKLWLACTQLEYRSMYPTAIMSFFSFCSLISSSPSLPTSSAGLTEIGFSMKICTPACSTSRDVSQQKTTYSRSSITRF